MRHAAALFAGAVLLLALSGCGGGEATSSMGTPAESAQSQLESAASELEVMTVEEAVDYFKTLSPQVLGLEGKSLGEYDVLHSQAMVPVDNVPCVEISVYGKSETTDTHTLAGSYLLARDGTALYKLDEATDSITRLEF